MMVLSLPTQKALERAQKAHSATETAEGTRMTNKAHEAFLTACMTLFYVMQTEQTPVKSDQDTGE